MTSVITFENNGVIDPVAIRTFGVSAKEGENPIGFFGTGLKYAIAIILRLGCKIVIHSGGVTYDFGVEKTGYRNQMFDVVTMNGIPLGFTTELGKTWEPWKAFRELYCNALDEGGVVYENEARIIERDKTYIIVTGSEIAKIYYERHDIVLQASPAFILPGLQVYNQPSNQVYYRGIKASNLENPSQLTYNITRKMELTEDRTIKHEYVRDSVIRAEIMQFAPVDLWKQILTANDLKYEARNMRFDDIFYDETPAFIQAVEEIPFKDITNPTAIMRYKKNRTKALGPAPLLPTNVQQAMIDRAKIICDEWLQVPITHPVHIAELAPDVLGQAFSGAIYISPRTFMHGTKMVAGTILEEQLHLQHRIIDCSREMQNHLIDLIVSTAENLKGELI